MQALLPTSRPAITWLRVAMTSTAHGFDLELPFCPSPYDVDQRLLSWEKAAWISRGAFEPDLSQRALNLVHPSNFATMVEALKVRDLGLKMGADLHQSCYWWLPGAKAEEVLAQLPPTAMGVGDRVRYRRGFLRSIGMTGDDGMRRWQGVFIQRIPLGSRWLIECEQRPVECHCGLGRTGPEPDCYRCQGTGQATRTRLNEVNLELAL